MLFWWWAQVAYIDSGIVLVEDNPKFLLKKFNYDKLEDVFLKVTQEMEKPQDNQLEDINNNIDKSFIRDIRSEMYKWKIRPRLDLSCNFQRLCVLINTNYIMFKRSPSYMILLLILPLLQIMICIVTIGANPHDIPIAVVNRDNKSTSLANVSILYFVCLVFIQSKIDFVLFCLDLPSRD